MKNTPTIQDFSKDANSILSMQDIEIINDPEKNYFILLDKETGAWSTLNKSCYHIIQGLLKEKFVLDDFKKQFPNDIGLLTLLFNAGVLKVNNKSSFEEKLRDRQCRISEANVCQIVLRYTPKCNLSCSYCYAHSNIESLLSMDNETAIYIVDKIKNTYPDKIINLSLHGGEPLLRYKDIVPLVRGIKKITNNVRFFIQTNATLVTKEIAQFFKDEDFNVGISIDGFDDKTNSHRNQINGKSSLKKSLIGLDHLISAGISPGLFTVVTSMNQDKLLEHFDFYVNKGVKKFSFSPIIQSGKAANDTYNVDIDRLVQTSIKLIERMNIINSQYDDIKDYVSEMNSTNLISNLTSLTIHNLCTMSPCGAGRTMLGFDVDGSVYSCDYFIGEPNFKIGNIFEMEDVKNTIHKSIFAQGLLNRDVNSIKECSVCQWKNICTYHCASDSYFNNHTLYNPHSMCTYAKKFIPEVIDLLYRRQIDLNNIVPC